jgi:hypothetical protein
MIQNEILLPIRFHPIPHERSGVTPSTGPANGQRFTDGFYYSKPKFSRVVSKLYTCPETSSFLMTVDNQPKSEGERWDLSDST